jgi:hypothetical protein
VEHENNMEAITGEEQHNEGQAHGKASYTTFTQPITSFCQMGLKGI